MKPRVLKNETGGSLERVAENLYRDPKSLRYYGRFRRNGQQLKMALGTTDRELADRKLKDFEKQIDEVKPKAGGRKLPFSIWDAKDDQLVGGVAHTVILSVKAGLDAEGGFARRMNALKNLCKYFGEKAIGSITTEDLTDWATSEF